MVAIWLFVLLLAILFVLSLFICIFLYCFVCQYQSKWLAVKTASEMTYTVSGGALNSTQTQTQTLYDYMIMYVGLFGHSAVVFLCFLMFFRVLCVFYWLFVWLCFFRWHFIDLFSCITASLFNKLSYLLTYCDILYTMMHAMYCILVLVQSLRGVPVCKKNVREVSIHIRAWTGPSGITEKWR